MLCPESAKSTRKLHRKRSRKSLQTIWRTATLCPQKSAHCSTMQRLIGKRAADFYEYAISQKNGCLVCSIYFQNLLKKNGIDFENFAFTPNEEILIEYGQAIAEDPKHVPEELFAKLKANFTEEEIVVITAMGVMMIANNYFNDILDVTPDKLV